MATKKDTITATYRGPIEAMHGHHHGGADVSAESSGMDGKRLA